MVKIAALCVAVSVVAALLRRSEEALALALTLCALLCALALLTAALAPVTALFRDLTALTGLAPAVFTPLLKLLAIALTVRLGGSFCRDASQEALAAVLESAGAVCALTVTVPLLRAVLSMVEGWL